MRGTASGTAKRIPLPERLDEFEPTIASRMGNPNRDWAVRAADGSFAEVPGTAQCRFKHGSFFGVRSTTSFTISRDTAIYTIGSCFARNVERALLAAGMRVPTTETEIDQSIYKTRPQYPNTLLNKYNPHSIATEIMRGLGHLRWPDRGIIALGNGLYFDPQASHLPLLPLDRTNYVRDLLDDILARLRDSTVLLLTLGLTETWFDIETGQPLNMINTTALRTIRPRLRFCNVTPHDAYEALAAALGELSAHNPDIKVIVTVSPVPLYNTFTGMDIVSANAYSKASLRVTAQMLADAFDFVEYFPSYEMVTNSPRDMALLADRAHVANDMVQYVINEFVATYVP